MKKMLMVTVVLSTVLCAESFSNLQLLYGKFDGDTAVYDVEDGKGKTTLTYEVNAFSKVGDIFAFIDYSMADGRLFVPGAVEGTKTAFYVEIQPRLSLSYLSGKDLSTGYVKDFFIATQLNAGSGADYRAGLIGLGMSLTVPKLDFFALNIYYKHENFVPFDTYSRDTAQLTFAYGTHFGDTGISLTGWLDWTGYNIQTQNQLLYKLADIAEGQKIEVGLEHLYYYEDEDVSNGYTTPETSVLQVMMKYSW